MTTSRHSKAEPSDQLTLFAAAHRANRSALQAEADEKASMMIVGSGQRWAGLLENSGHLGLFVKTLMTSTAWGSTRSRMIWKPWITKCGRLGFQLVRAGLTTYGRAVGWSATPTAKANQTAPSMQKWPGCRNVDLTPEVLEERMSFPRGWTDVD